MYSHLHREGHIHQLLRPDPDWPVLPARVSARLLALLRPVFEDEAGQIQIQGLRRPGVRQFGFISH
jgi:hypothetical protein